jgi:hypothetical protein
MRTTGSSVGNGVGVTVAMGVGLGPGVIVKTGVGMGSGIIVQADMTAMVHSQINFLRFM